jgi:[ribosomal protein S5]-alanine N-acetyltransferase
VGERGPLGGPEGGDEKEMIPPTIQLESTCLRPLRIEDAVAWHSYLSDPAVIELTSYPAMSLAAVTSMLETCLAGYAAGSSCTWALVADEDSLVGTCGFCRLARDGGVAELAYDLARRHWGRGWMSQAVRACIEWALAQPEFRRVEASVMVGNARSERLLKRAGFKQEGLLKAYRVCRGEPRDYILFSLGRADWLGQRTGRPTRACT